MDGSKQTPMADGEATNKPSKGPIHDPLASAPEVSSDASLSPLAGDSPDTVPTKPMLTRQNEQVPRASTAFRERSNKEPTARTEHRLRSIPSPQIPIPEGFKPPFLPTGNQSRALPNLPRRRKGGSGNLLSFLFLFVLPVLAAVAYFGFLASNQYVAEFRFTVQDTSASSSSAATSMITSMLGSSSSPSMSQNYVVVDYLTSRQAIDELQSRINLREMYTRPSIDWWARFPTNRSKEAFVYYWQRMITAQYDQVTGLATVQVRAFTPEDAKKIGDTLVTLAEELINRIAMRTQYDAVRFAEVEVHRQEDRLKAIKAKLTEFRNREGVIDPNASVVASNSSLSQSLRQNLAYLETTLAGLVKQNIGPNSPAVQNLNSQINATKDQISIVEKQVKNNKTGSALSAVVGEYEQLDLERQFAMAMVTSAMQGLDQARATAAAQHLYITPYVRPGLPESSTYPRRWTSILLFTVFAFMGWTVLVLIFRSIREHYT